MDYENQKKQFLENRKKLLEEYKNFLYKTMKLASELGNLINSASVEQKIDYIANTMNSEDMNKFTRLVVALEYVEDPTNTQVLSALQENIEINQNKSK